MRRVLVLAALVGTISIVSLPGCGNGALTGQGQPCTTSEECAPGLLCDYGQAKPKCEPSESVSRDMAAPVPDGAVPDAGAPDLASTVTD